MAMDKLAAAGVPQLVMVADPASEQFHRLDSTPPVHQFNAPIRTSQAIADLLALTPSIHARKPPIGVNGDGAVSVHVVHDAYGDDAYWVVASLLKAGGASMRAGEYPALSTGSTFVGSSVLVVVAKTSHVTQAARSLAAFVPEPVIILRPPTDGAAAAA